jgi:hypothetical protein
MTEAMNALDQRIVDHIPETPADISAQLRLFRALGCESSGWSDERDERLYKSMMAGLSRLAGRATKGLVERSIELGARAEANAAPPTALNVLEDELANIEGLSELMVEMGNDGNKRHLVYLGFRLEDHHHAAYEAFETLHAALGWRPVGQDAS